MAVPYPPGSDAYGEAEWDLGTPMVKQSGIWRRLWWSRVGSGDAYGEAE